MNNTQVVIKKSYTDGIGNILKCFITSFSISDNPKIECNSDFIYGAYDTILDKKHIFNENNNTNIEYIYTWRLLILKSEDFQDHIPSEYDNQDNGVGNYKFNNLFCSKHIDLNYDSSKINSHISQRIFNNIDKISFNKTIINTVEKTFELFKNKYSLGISVRTWKSKHETNIQRPYDSNTYKSKINDVMQLHPNINVILLSVDNNDILDEYINFLKSFNVDIILLNKSNNINDIQFALFKVLILSKCNYFIGNRISTFSELVFWFSKHKTEVYSVF